MSRLVLRLMRLKKLDDDALYLLGRKERRQVPHIRECMQFSWKRCGQPCIYPLSTLQSRMRIFSIKDNARRLDISQCPIEFELHHGDKVLRRHCFIGMTNIKVTKPYEIGHTREQAILMRIHHEPVEYLE